MRVEPIPIEWHSKLPIFASESFLKAVGDEYGWLGGFDDNGGIRCILPYTVIRKAIFRLVRFRVETIFLDKEIDIAEEKSFLNSVVEYFRSIGADVIIPATTNTIFRTYPDGADAAPYGSYVMDLCQPEEVLWKKIAGKMRQNINSARRKGIAIRSGIEHLDEAYRLVVDTFSRSGLPFMGHDSFRRYVLALGENSKIMIADYQGKAQSYVVFAYSDYCAYAVYGGNITNQEQGAQKLLLWEAIRCFQNLGVKRYDFVGARINPEIGSKQAGINSLKKHFGAQLRQGFMWKFSLRPVKSMAYNLGVRFLRGGDIVDNERHKLRETGTTTQDTVAVT